MTTPRDDTNDDAAAASREAFASLPEELAPPAKLEERVVSALKARGEIHGDRASRRYGIVAAGLAAALAFFVAGLGVGRRSARPRPPAEAAATAAPQWILLLYEDGDYRAAPPKEEAARVREYAEWARVLASRGSLLGGEKLNESGKLLARAEGRVQVNDDSPASGEGVLAGYFVIRAEGLEDAISLASDCPHLKYGGRISLRRIDPT